jgi:RNA polymerase subunit RPABC4/transcription elongation factor Spt4
MTLSREQVETAYRNAWGETHTTSELLDNLTERLNATLAQPAAPETERLLVCPSCGEESKASEWLALAIEAPETERLREAAKRVLEHHTMQANHWQLDRHQCWTELRAAIEAGDGL